MKKIFIVLGLSLFALSSFATTVYDIQYTTNPGPDGTYPSPLEDQDVTVTGIVTGSDYYVSGNSNRFFISDPGGGPWRGIFVFNYDYIVEVGDEVEVSGTVIEYYGMTELTSITNVTILSSGNPVPAPVLLQTADLVDPDDAEPYEGCLVEVRDVVVTSAQNNYGEWYVTDISTVPCQIDDGFFQLDSVTPPIVITVGMEWAAIRGCVDYSYDEYAINPRTPDDLMDELSAPYSIVPAGHEFIGCYPNPFNPETTAFLNLATNTQLTMNVYNIKGEKVRTLLAGQLQAGEHHILWNGRNDQNENVTSGIYFMHAESDNGDFTSVKKVVLLK